MSKTNYRNSGNVVELGLWDDMARNFNKNEYDSMEKPVIIAVSSCKVSLYGATAQFTFFTPNADVVTGADCTQLVNLHDTPSPRKFPPEILNLQSRKHIFQFHYNPSCEKGKIDFYFDDILDKPVQITSGTELETEAPCDVTIRTPPTTDTCILLKGTPDTSIKETGSESPGKKTHDERTAEGIPSKTTSKRLLFQDDPDEQK
ncbi:hypothetical protein Tco_0484871 [Tanacetum coccineum]